MNPITRRNILASSAGLVAGGALLGRRSAHAAQHEHAGAPAVSAQEPGDYTPVVTPNGASLPWKLVEGVKVYHLVAEPVLHEFAPGLEAYCWGYNGRVHGPTIEAVEGDRVRIYVTNKLGAPTTKARSDTRCGAWSVRWPPRSRPAALIRPPQPGSRFAERPDLTCKGTTQ